MNRRQFVALAGASLLPAAGCSDIEGLGGAAYERSDLSLTVGLECVSAGSDDVVVTASWEWADGNGGSPPEDMLVIEWEDEKWSLLEAAHDTTEVVRFDGKGVADGREGVLFEHDDFDAEEGTTYAASCKLAPNGDFEPAVRNVAGTFAHVRTERGANATEEPVGDWFTDIDEEWRVQEVTDQRAAACGDGGS
jgi:hypothetical protein